MLEGSERFPSGTFNVITLFDAQMGPEDDDGDDEGCI